jgi:hypothetical protein
VAAKPVSTETTTTRPEVVFLFFFFTATFASLDWEEYNRDTDRESKNS